MGLEKVKQEILEKAQKEASEILDAASAEARTIAKSAEKQAQESEKRAQDDAEKAAEAMKKKGLASAELELQKQALSLKSGLMEAVFSEARKKLKHLGEKKRQAHVRALLESAMKEIDIALVQCNASDAAVLEGGRLKIVKNDSIAGGIIAESADGRLRVDYSYDALLEQARSKVLNNVARTLFEK